MRTGRRSASLVALALLPAGTLAGHALAYRAQHGVESLPHSYVTGASFAATVLLTLAIVRVIRRGMGGRDAPLPAVLLVAQPAIFLLQESVEHLVGGHHLADVARSPAVRWGLALQVLTGAVLLVLSFLAGVAGRILAERRSRPPATITDGDAGRPVRSAAGTTAPVRDATSERGPPPYLVPA